MFLVTAISLAEDEDFKKAVGKTAQGFGELLRDALTNPESDLIGNILGGVGSLATTIGDNFLKGAFGGKDFTGTATSTLASSLVIALTALALSSKLRVAAVYVGRQIATMIGAGTAVAKGGAGGVVGALKNNAGTIANGVGLAGGLCWL